ncbi:hypothetical protein ACFQ6C_26635 [Streptomyces sp. NPDC056454]|uniref:hypothetical protein n=1 Tax=Streptomyces sp. NPDC056454 TaxID=3345823 RepID=UPI0036D1CE98
MDLKIEFADSLDIALRGFAVLPWLKITETSDEERESWVSWTLYADGRLLHRSGMEHSDVVTALREVAWGWQELPGLGSDEELFSDAALEIQNWVCGRTETLSDDTCAAVVLAHHYGTRAASCLYFTGVRLPKQEAERVARMKAYPAVGPVGRLTEGE